LQKNVLKEILNAMEDEKIVDIAKRCAAYTKDIRLLMTGRNDVKGFFTILRARAKRSGFPLREIEGNNGREFII
jgi:hypothetical protein